MPLKLGYYTEAIVSQENGTVSFERKYPDGHTVTISYDNIVKEDARNNMNQMPMKALKTVSMENVLKNKWAAYDFETMAKPLDKIDSAGLPHQQLNIVSAAFYTRMKDGKEWIKTFYINENENYMDSKALMRNFAKYVVAYTWRSRHDLFLFAHNAAKFDMVFLLEALIDTAEVDDKIDVLINNGKLIQVKYTINGKLTGKENKDILKYSVVFRDSCLLLPSSLAKLAKQFGVENKGDYPVNNLNDQTNWIEVKKDLIKYNIQDCRILYQIIEIYAKMNVEAFGVDIFKAPTGAANAFQIFRTKYLDDSKTFIPLSTKDIYDFIKPAYYGGACDVYKPSNPEGTLLQYFDINSLYPSVMAKYPMPTGKYKIVRDSQLNVEDPNLYAFVKCRITCPDNIKVPLLLRRVNNKSIAGTGTWTGSYYSVELREAISLGYRVDPIEAIIFEGNMVFDHYINDVYAKRLQTKKSDPMNFIYKQTMNSTYGRFGLRPYLSDTQIIHKDEVNNWSSRKDILEIKEFGNKAMVVTEKIYNETLVEDKDGNNLQISIPIAAAVTALARIEIHRVKRHAAANDELYYSDTDSVVTSGTLPDELIGKGLGQLKLECTAEKGVFLAPKVYALHNVVEDGKPLPDIIKAKGLKNTSGLTFEVFEQMLNKDFVYKSYQPKWFRDFEKGSITIKNLHVMTRITEGKRAVIVDLDNKFVDTLALNFIDDVQTTPNIIKRGLPIAVLPLIAAPKSLVTEAIVAAIELPIIETIAPNDSILGLPEIINKESDPAGDIPTPVDDSVDDYLEIPQDDIPSDLNITNDYEPTDDDFVYESDVDDGVDIDIVNDIEAHDPIDLLLDQTDKLFAKPIKIVKPRNVLDELLWQPEEPLIWQSNGFTPNQSAIWETPLIEEVPITERFIVQDGNIKAETQEAAQDTLYQELEAKLAEVQGKIDELVKYTDSFGLDIELIPDKKGLVAKLDNLLDERDTLYQKLDKLDGFEPIKSDNKTTEIVPQVAKEPLKLIKHKAKKGEKLTPQQIAENKAIKKAEFMASPKGARWLNEKFILELDGLLQSCKTIEAKDQVIEEFKSRGLKQAEFINSMIDKYQPASATNVVSTWLANWAKSSPILAQSWAIQNPERAQEIDESIKILLETDKTEDYFEYKGPYFKQGG